VKSPHKAARQAEVQRQYAQGIADQLKRETRAFQATYADYRDSRSMSCLPHAPYEYHKRGPAEPGGASSVSAGWRNTTERSLLSQRAKSDPALHAVLRRSASRMASPAAYERMEVAVSAGSGVRDGERDTLGEGEGVGDTLGESEEACRPAAAPAASRQPAVDTGEEGAGGNVEGGTNSRRASGEDTAIAWRGYREARGLRLERFSPSFGVMRIGDLPDGKYERGTMAAVPSPSSTPGRSCIEGWMAKDPAEALSELEVMLVPCQTSSSAVPTGSAKGGRKPGAAGRASK